MDKIKLPHQIGRHCAFWRMVTDAMLTLISSAEHADSNVTPHEAEAFLQAQATESLTAAAAPVTEEEEDLFGSMA